MEREYQERDQKHQFNKLFYRYSQEFKCPKIDRPCSDKVWAACCIIMLIWLICLPLYFIVARSHSLPYIINHDFRGDICGVTQTKRPYVAQIRQIGASICVQSCEQSTQCLYHPDGITIHYDWCYQTSPSQPHYGRCNQTEITKQLAFQQISKSEPILQLCILASVVTSGCTILLISMCSILNIVWYLNIITTIVLMVVSGWLMTDRQTHTLIIYSMVIISCVINVVESLLRRKEHMKYSEMASKIVSSSRCKLEICIIMVGSIAIRGVLTLLQLYTFTNVVKMAHLNTIQQTLFPNGYVKTYTIGQINWILCLVYIPVYVFMMQYLLHMQQCAISACCQVEYFNGKTHNGMALRIVVKECGFLMKYTLIRVIVDMFNQFYRIVRWINSMPVIRYAVRSVYASIQQQYEYTTKYVHEYCPHQRVFQAQGLLQGGAISYYLMNRHQSVRMSQNGSVLFSLVSWMLVSIYLYSQQDTTSVKYISMHSVVVLMSIFHGMLMSSAVVQAVDQVVRSILYCAAANHEMRYIERKYQADIEQVWMVERTNKVKNILEMDTKEDVREDIVERIQMKEEGKQQTKEEIKEERKEQVPDAKQPIQDNVLTFRYKTREQKKQPKKRNRQSNPTDLILGWN